jgi:hypothetical protein
MSVFKIMKKLLLETLHKLFAVLVSYEYVYSI